MKYVARLTDARQWNSLVNVKRNISAKKERHLCNLDGGLKLDTTGTITSFTSTAGGYSEIGAAHSQIHPTLHRSNWSTNPPPHLPFTVSTHRHPSSPHCHE